VETLKALIDYSHNGDAESVDIVTVGTLKALIDYNHSGDAESVDRLDYQWRH
jgi:hypothetical protein